MKRALLILPLLLATPLASAQSGYDLFQQALVKERAEGNAEAALALYERIGNEYASDRALAARALLQQGLLYEKLGRQVEAQRAFEALVSQYADQAEVARQARARLVVAAPAKSASGLNVRQILANTDILGAPSPDGRYLSFVDWDTGDLAVHDLEKGTARRLTNKGPWIESNDYALESVFSPDGKQVAFTWYEDQSGVLSLVTIGLDGSGRRVLYRNPELQYVQPHDWSPDGQHILALLTRKDRTNQIALIAATDGSVRTLKTLDWRYPIKMSFSPDGRFIAYDFFEREEGVERDVFVMALDGSREARVVEHPANDFLLGWTPGGERLLFASDRSGNASAWLVDVAEGRARGEPRLIKADLGYRIRPLGTTREGRFFFGLTIGDMDVYTTTFDVETGPFLAPPRPAGGRFVKVNQYADWSPDGKHLAFISDRGSVPKGPGSSFLVIRSLETGQERVIPQQMSYFSGLVWRPGGGSILIWGQDERRRPAFHLVDTETGEVTPFLHSEEPFLLGFPDWSADGRVLYYALIDSEQQRLQLVARELDTGNIQTLIDLTDNGGIRPLAVSPDGRNVVFVHGEPGEGNEDDAILMLVSTAGGEARELLRVSWPEFFIWPVLTFTPDGRHVLFVKRRLGDANTAETTAVYVIPTEGGTPRELDFGAWRDDVQWSFRALRFHPDGQQVVFTHGWNRLDIWVMEHFLPDLEGTR